MFSSFVMVGHFVPQALLSAILWWIKETLADVDCPRLCFCIKANKIVYCSSKGLATLPPSLPEGTLQLNVNGNMFASTRLITTNFTAYNDLEHLYLSECGIQTIESYSFATLSKLKWLDLSNNRITVIKPRTFTGLTLDHLFLNGNRDIMLLPDSFLGLITSGLHLHECSLKEFSPDVILPLTNISTPLKNLWLNHNELQVLDKSFQLVFGSFLHLRLGSNPLRCDCSTMWIKELYDKKSEIFKGAKSPSCYLPLRLKGKSFDELSLFEFQCHSPTMKNIELTFSQNDGKLKCSASGDPAPVLYWIQPTGKTARFGPSQTDNLLTNEGILELSSYHRTNINGLFICVASNDAGNATLTVNISWPDFFASDRPDKPGLYPSTTLYAMNNNKNFYLTQRPSLQGQSHSSNNHTGQRDLIHFSVSNRRRFSLNELILAIIITHVCTLLVSAIFVYICYRRKIKGLREYSTCEVNKTLKRCGPNEFEYRQASGLQKHIGLSYSDLNDTRAHLVSNHANNFVI